MNANYPMMKCGHQANSICNGTPACVICAGLREEAYQTADGINLDGRIAECSCGSRRPSLDAYTGRLAFFEYRGPGSNRAQNACKICKYFKVAHNVERVGYEHPAAGHEFMPMPEGYETDTYYCGHSGWD